MLKTEELTTESVNNHTAELISGQYHLKKSHSYILLHINKLRTIIADSDGLMVILASE